MSKVQQAGFTLVELLVSMVIVVMLLLVLVTITDSTRKIWSSTTTKVSQFQEAREAFESLTRRIGQSTLNTYLAYKYANSGGTPDTTKPPTGYTRQSELRFINGQAANLITASFAGNCPTHAVFFQAPLGYVNNKDYVDLNKLLNTCGYFIQYGDDRKSRPPFVSETILPLRYRFRLMELVEPSESLALYKYTNNKPTYAGTEWFNDPLSNATSPVQVRAENIVALVILPKLTPKEDATGVKLAPSYSYDSTAKNSDPTINPLNQLPPVLQVTMVAIDETSFALARPGAQMVNYADKLFSDATLFDADMAQLQANLSGRLFKGTTGDVNPTLPSPHPLNYRIFTTNVSLRAAKWSREQVN